MIDIELITKKEFEDFLVMQKRIFDIVENKTKELAMILYDRLPDGEICEFDIEESPFEQKCIFVEFEKYYCGESCLEQYNLPFDFLYNDLAPKRYKLIYDEGERVKKERCIQLEESKIEQDKINLEKFDRSEYEKLKLKFE